MTHDHEQNKGTMELSANITCESEEATFTGNFDFTLNKYDSGWDVDEMSLNDSTFTVKAGPTEEYILTEFQSYDLQSLFSVPLRTKTKLSGLEYEDGQPYATAKLELSTGTGLVKISLPVTLNYIYDGKWTQASDSIDLLTDQQILDAATFTANIPTGTYQYYQMGGTVYSIRLFEEADPDNPYYCDVISYDSLFGPQITGEYYGPVELSYDLTEVICGPLYFTFDPSGSPTFTDPDMQWRDGVYKYSDSTSLADGLNALIAVSEMHDLSLSAHEISKYALAQSIPEEDIRRGNTVSTADREAYLAILAEDPAFQLDNPDNIYDPELESDKTDEELSFREFEQKYGYFYGYCDDFGKTHVVGSDPY